MLGVVGQQPFQGPPHHWFHGAATPTRPGALHLGQCDVASSAFRQGDGAGPERQPEAEVGIGDAVAAVLGVRASRKWQIVDHDPFTPQLLQKGPQGS
jgi:hypothetical protein